MKPRFVRLFVVMLVLVAAFLWLGKWQWDSAHDSQSNKDIAKWASQKRVPLTTLMKPMEAFDNSHSLRPVTVTGTYDTAKTELVAGRVLRGERGYWLVTPLVVDGNGARIPVLRGFVTTTSHMPKPPSGKVTIEGAVAPGESVSQMGALPPGQIGTIDMGLLLNEWGGKVYNAFIFSTKQTPATAHQAGAASVAYVAPPVDRKTTINLRNAMYAVQWVVFSGFAIFMWVKMVRDDSAADAVLDGDSGAGSVEDDGGRGDGDAGAAGRHSPDSGHDGTMNGNDAEGEKE